ncbi:50S ribosomal protein L15 [Thermocladium modestius]|uniref:Large ribosomal subunit protein uL15 n=1 Tax=Thermocladium modestius TaxID=62609 RepID=A0A830GVW1_9CREN|nr:uL15 family ribosomal protein [Thermocladium modestius]GGP21316.1 50S ribosomal protein L15 [Thermocladium modestius]
MTRRFTKKTRKLRGWRTHSWGRVGQHRRNNSGGSERVGLLKHKKSLLMELAEKNNGWPLIGKHGFVQPPPLRSRLKSINVGRLGEVVRELAAQGKAVQESGKYVVDLAALGYDKLLGGGSINEPIMVRAAAASASAIEKIRKAGGEVVIQRGLLH